MEDVMEGILAFVLMAVALVLFVVALRKVL